MSEPTQAALPAPEWPPPNISEWLRDGTVVTCHLVAELRLWLAWAEADQADCPYCFPDADAHAKASEGGRDERA